MIFDLGQVRFETYFGLSLGNLDLDLAESRVELSGIDLVVSIETVEVTESSSETTDSLGTSSLDLGSDALEN